MKNPETEIHPTAMVDPGAELGEGVRVGPYSVIGPNVKVGRDTRIHSHVILDGNTEIGQRNDIFSGACLGTPPQVRDYRAVSRSRLLIGDDNVIREYATISPGMKDGSCTVIGNGNLLMMTVHVGHDCILGNNTWIANGAGLSGHVELEDCAVIGGIVGVHQYVRIGKYSMVGGVSRVVMDIPPFSLCSGHPARLHGMNSIGLRRAGYSAKDAMRIKSAIRTLFFASLPLSEAVAKVGTEFAGNPDVEHLLAFIQRSKRGICRVVTADECDE